MTRAFPVAALLQRALLAAISLYQRGISPFLGPHCRYTPTCSAYAAEAIRIHGPLAGGRMALKRILRCHPRSPGGYDPVPQSKSTGTRP